MHIARRDHLTLLIVLSVHVVSGFAALPQGGRVDPERVLAERFRFSTDELAKARSGQPVAKLIEGADRNELAVSGAIRLEGDKNRVAEWIKNIEHFRGAADLGLARVVSVPPTVASFADLTLDATDLEALRECASTSCDLRLSTEAISDLRTKVQWGTPSAAAQASTVVRQMLVSYAAAYLHGGDAALGNGFADLLQRAANLNQLVPEFARYLQQFPGETLAGVEQRLYWSTMPAGKVSIVSLHHLVIHRGAAGEMVIADKTIYSTRYFEVGALVISLQDAVDGRGYYLIAGSRVRSSELTGIAASVLRRQIQRSAVDTVETYLSWIRDSLSLPRGK